MKSRRPVTIEEEITAWKCRALSAERALAAAQVEIAESWRASRALADHEQRTAARAERQR